MWVKKYQLVKAQDRHGRDPKPPAEQSTCFLLIGTCKVKFQPVSPLASPGLVGWREMGGSGSSAFPHYQGPACVCARACVRLRMRTRVCVHVHLQAHVWVHLTCVCIRLWKLEITEHLVLNEACYQVVNKEDSGGLKCRV